MKNLKRVMCLLLATAMVLCTFVGCVDKGGPGGTVISNETTRLVLASAELEGVFNPFYSSSGADGTIIGMTQIGMLSSDKYGVVSYGKDEACVVLDMETVFVDENGNVVDENSGNIANTVYRFVLKNDLKFSNGSPLTMKDVLFNMYVYLDPAYYGSSTMYSTDIVGLQAYRTQSTNESEQDSFNEQFDVLAANRIQRFLECLEIVYDEADGSLTEESMRSALQAAVNMATELDPEYATVMADYELARQYFMEELQSDYNYARGTAQDIVFTDKSGKKVTLTTDTEAFLYTEGLIRWNEDEYKFEYSLGEDSKNWSEEKAIKAIYDNYIPNQVDVVITAWATAQKLMTYFSFLEKQKYFETLDSQIESVSGMTVALRMLTSTRFWRSPSTRLTPRQSATSPSPLLLCTTTPMMSRSLSSTTRRTSVLSTVASSSRTKSSRTPARSVFLWAQVLTRQPPVPVTAPMSLPVPSRLTTLFTSSVTRTSCSPLRSSTSTTRSFLPT